MILVIHGMLNASLLFCYAHWEGRLIICSFKIPNMAEELDIQFCVQ